MSFSAPPSAHGSATRAGTPADQAHGLRQMFATRSLRFVPIVANASAGCGGLVLERLCTAYATLGLHTLVVDASDQARPPCELAEFDLSEGIEPLSRQVSYMAARGLPLRHVDARGCCASLLDALADAAPQSDVVLVLASASELVRLFAQRARGHNLRPLVFTNDLAEGLKDAYTSVKLLSQRGGWMAYDLVVCAGARSRQAPQVAERLAQCADTFMGVAQRHWMLLDPHERPESDISPKLQDLAGGLLRHALPVALGDNAFDHLVYPGAALPSRRATALN
jgi:flagellar biosynthesis protein FlhG